MIAFGPMAAKAENCARKRYDGNCARKRYDGGWSAKAANCAIKKVPGMRAVGLVVATSARKRYTYDSGWSDGCTA